MDCTTKCSKVHCKSKRGGKEVDEISRLRGYGRIEMPGINFVPLNVYFDNEKINKYQIKLGNISAGRWYLACKSS